MAKPDETKNPYGATTAFYSPKEFNYDEQLALKYGTDASRRDKRKFKKYWNSDQRYEDQLAFDKAENDKMFASADARFREINDAWQASQTKPEPAPTPEPQPTLAPAPQTQPRPQLTPRPDAYWNQQAQQYGFADMNAVAEWQRQNGLEADGKFGQNSLAKWNELQAARQAQTPAPAPAQQKSIGRDIADDMPLIGSFVTGRDFVRDPSKQTAAAFGKRLLWDTFGAPAAGFRMMKGLWDGAKGWWNSLPENKQGGSLVKMHQQGGQMQSQQEQVVALVQAAMQGDKKATQTVNQIMEAAKAGDQQAVQLAGMIQQVVQQIQGQATAAKWGSKLNYIKSLKYAKGGKTCPACEQKVEMKKCGGKKAKKRYFGGYL